MNNNHSKLKNGPLLPVYLLYGTESYLMMQYRDILLKRTGIPFGDMNFTKYTSQNYDTAACIGTARTLPFFAERRVILVQKADVFSKPDKDLLEYLKSPEPATCLIFVEDSVSAKLGTFKAIDKAEGAFEFSLPSQARLENWLIKKISAAGKRITKTAFSAFWVRCGSDMSRMTLELEKLLAYCGDKPDIDLEDVETICSGSSEAKIFDMTDAIAAKDRSKALRLCDDLLEKKETPVRIIMMTVRLLNQLLTICEMTDARAKDSEISTKLHVPMYILRKKLKPMSYNFSPDELKHLINLSCCLDHEIKTGRISGELAVTKLIVMGTGSLKD